MCVQQRWCRTTTESSRHNHIYWRGRLSAFAEHDNVQPTVVAVAAAAAVAAAVQQPHGRRCATRGLMRQWACVLTMLALHAIQFNI